jgi:hypothetical protein
VFHPLLLCAACAPVSRLPPLPGDEIKAEQHELAHANLGHLNKQRANAIIGWIGGAAADAGIMLGAMSTRGAFSRVLNQAGVRAFSIAFEREADYVGGYLYRPRRLGSYSGATFHSL